MSSPVSIKDAAAERDFYSDQAVGSEETIDDFITGLENDLAGAIQCLRSAPVGEMIDPVVPASTISHLYFRSASLRFLMRDSYRDIHAALREWIECEDFFPAYLGLDKTYASPRFRELLKALERDSRFKLAFTALRQGRGRAKADIATFKFLRSNIAKISGEIAFEISQQIQLLDEAGAHWARESHGDAIRKHLNSEAMAGLDQLTWSIEPVGWTPLSDTVAVTTNDGRTFGPLPWIKAAERKLVMFPVSSDRMVVGRSGDRLPLPQDFVEIFVSASDHFVVTDGPMPNPEVRDLIGGRKQELFSETLAALKADVLKKPLSKHFGKGSH